MKSGEHWWGAHTPVLLCGDQQSLLKDGSTWHTVLCSPGVLATPWGYLLATVLSWENAS